MEMAPGRAARDRERPQTDPRAQGKIDDHQIGDALFERPGTELAHLNCTNAKLLSGAQ